MGSGMGQGGNGHGNSGVMTGMTGMNGSNQNSMMSNGMGGMLLISGGNSLHSNGTLITISEAIDLARKYLAARTETNLALDEVEEWEYNFYVVIKETDSSNKAFQLIIDKWSGVIMPEPGPDMMWNTKYSGAGMGRWESMGFSSRSTPPMTVTPDAAATAANNFLKARFAPGRNLAVAVPADVFYGYYNFDVNDVATGKKYGMLSVNGYTGQVWFHTWHGNFIQGQEITN
jgi:hypothetical protein